MGSIQSEWLCEIEPHIFSIDKANVNLVKHNIRHFEKFYRKWGFSFHNNCENALSMFKLHYDLYKDKKTTIKPFIDTTKNSEIKDRLRNIILDYAFTDSCFN